MLIFVESMIAYLLVPADDSFTNQSASHNILWRKVYVGTVACIIQIVPNTEVQFRLHQIMKYN
jgi:hypothetical protein